MQVNHWDHLGIVKPSLRPAEGTGSRRLYSPDDLAAVEVARRLRSLNVSLECLTTAMRGLRALWPALATVPSDAVVVIRPDGVCQQLAGGTDPTALLSTDRAGIILDLAGIMGDLRSRQALGPATAPAGPAQPRARPTRRPRAGRKEERQGARTEGEGVGSGYSILVFLLGGALIRGRVGQRLG